MFILEISEYIAVMDTATLDDIPDDTVLDQFLLADPPQFDENLFLGKLEPHDLGQLGQHHDLSQFEQHHDLGQFEQHHDLGQQFGHELGHAASSDGRDPTTCTFQFILPDGTVQDFTADDEGNITITLDEDNNIVLDMEQDETETKTGENKENRTKKGNTPKKRGRKTKEEEKRLLVESSNREANEKLGKEVREIVDTFNKNGIDQGDAFRLIVNATEALKVLRI